MRDHRKVAARALVALLAVAAGLGIGFSTPEAEAHVAACGFVTVEKDSTTTMVTLVDYCQVDGCNGETGFLVSHYQPPTGAGGVEAEAWVCVVVH